MAEVSYLVSVTRATTTMLTHLDHNLLLVVVAVEGVANSLNQVGEAVVAEKT